MASYKKKYIPNRTLLISYGKQLGEFMVCINCIGVPTFIKKYVIRYL